MASDRATGERYLEHFSDGGTQKQTGGGYGTPGPISQGRGIAARVGTGGVEGSEPDLRPGGPQEIRRRVGVDAGVVQA
jgi:hypothetical protein